MKPEMFSKVKPINIEDEMRGSYIEYAMSVIIGRALPDVRDGMKPVHRRILYAMKDLKNTYSNSYKKSARIVGDVIGKYHPHGDSAVYDSLVRMAQNFRMRYMLVDGQGNFGSVDGDPPAAMRYTEVRMARITDEMLRDIEKETVTFTPNYDDSLNEPSVLPSRLPNLLINGSSGIAVGMATNIPPHNLSEIIGAVIHLIKHPQAAIEDLLQHVPGPDFPTGAFICGRAGILQAYKTGRGLVKMRARTDIEKIKKGSEREAIIVTELPFEVNKAKLIEKIADLVKNKVITGISELRDESDRKGMRIYIELKRDADANILLNKLYKSTNLQTTFGINMLAIVKGQPRVLNIKEALTHFIQHRKEVVLRRTRFDLSKAKTQAHILEGLKKALDHIDEIIALIKKSPGPQQAKESLMLRFQFTQSQAKAILEMRLQRLTGLEREKIISELEQLRKEIARLEEILRDEKVLFTLISDELLEIKQKYGDHRRTQIIQDVGDFNIEDLIPQEEMVVTVSHRGYIKRNPLSLYRAQRRGGKGITGASTREDDFIKQIFNAHTHSYIMIFTNIGRCYWLKVYQVPTAGRTSKGKPIINLVNLAKDEQVLGILPVEEFKEGQYITMVTKNGIIKKTDLMAYSNPRSIGIIAIKFEEDDELIDVQLTDGECEIFIASRLGQTARFNETDVRPMGRVARGVKGINLAENDQVVGMGVLNEKSTILTITENGFGKRTKHTEYRKTKRGGKGVITIKTTKRNGKVVGIMKVSDDDQLMILTSSGKMIRLETSGISVISRNTQGVKLVSLSANEKVIGFTRLAKTDESDDQSQKSKQLELLQDK